MSDPINPDYYERNGIKVYKVIEAFDLGFYEGTALAYILRAGKKGARKQDLEKAIWNLQRKVELLSNEE